ncbi:hypothetical protein SAMN05660464_0936 [Geodermatophilus dictyosporus]|uniref:Uncharacterized protein n=1 Tax=Geodermatophilus dictyosporus TaxID=1523247 RepID=A0A1I5JR77_9ACTN|nr:hypothetical protein [Geodermatophilus dictyosporus]SFO74846.1 hypothetical protein SAMN05660464_0936 [Geodermatophilus dictyosporus]
MTTATQTPTAPTTGKDVHAAEVARLDDDLAAREARLARLAPEAAARREQLQKATAELAALKQAGSTLQQQLNAATSQPERHRLEQALERNLIDQGPRNDARLTAAEQLASIELAVVRQTAQAARTRADLTRATAELTRARQETAAATARVNALAETVTALQDTAGRLSDPPAPIPAPGGRTAAPAPTTAAGPATAAAPPPKPAAVARGRLEEMLGGPGMLGRLRERVAAARKDGVTRAQAVADAEALVRQAASARSPVDGAVAAAAAALTVARVAVQDLVEGGPVRMAAAEATLTAITEFPRIPEQVAIQDVAAEVEKGTDGALDRWEVMVPVAVTELAIGFIDVEAELAAVRALDVADLTRRQAEADAAYAAALTTQLTRQREVDAAAEVLAAAADEVTAREKTAADRRLSLVRGDR